MSSSADTDREGLTAANLRRHVGLLEKRLLRNQQDRLESPDDPERWIKSEVDLEEQIRMFRDLSTMPELFESFEEYGGLRILCDALSHPNIDISIATLNVLNELLDPELIVGLQKADHFLKAVHSLGFHKLCITTLLKIDEDNSEVDYEGVKSALEMLESLVEMFPSVVEEVSANVELLLFLLKRMKSSKTVEYDSNRVQASELLCVLFQQSEECLKLVGGPKVEGIDKLLRIVTVYRKKDPEGVEEEEIVENAFQCLCNLMLVAPNRVAFGKLQGIKLLVRLIKERRFTYQLAIKLLDYALMDCPASCTLFVEGMGLKSIFSVLMRKGVKTKAGTEAEKQEDEHVLGALHSLCTHCTGTELARVMNKFVEHKYEKLERLVELHEKYTSLSKAAVNRMDNKSTSAKSMYSALNLNEDTQDYLDKYEAGLSICQLVNCIFLRLYNMGNKNLSTCLLLLLHNKDYLEHLDDSASDSRQHMEKLLKNFLIGCSDSGLFN
ncbi:hypothetical protein X943_003741 [Babesia divergens]|uniref:Beta-catenin-like protein 1 N-terminal domain-containing protein n=1 Tax=Babesia divergens TaxID=32595 RepID=A0AAD9LEH1_BABDI|nr:hypothetical protein X943_003741 [Babesia divergens]